MGWTCRARAIAARASVLRPSNRLEGATCASPLGRFCANRRSAAFMAAASKIGEYLRPAYARRKMASKYIGCDVYGETLQLSGRILANNNRVDSRCDTFNRLVEKMLGRIMDNVKAIRMRFDFGDKSTGVRH